MDEHENVFILYNISAVKSLEQVCGIIMLPSQSRNASEARHSPELRAIAGDDDELGLALSQRLEGLLHSQAVFPALHDQSESGVDALQRLLGFLRRNHFDSFF